jgi:hypothetical protein
MRNNWNSKTLCQKITNTHLYVAFKNYCPVKCSLPCSLLCSFQSRRRAMCVGFVAHVAIFRKKLKNNLSILRKYSPCILLRQTSFAYSHAGRRGRGRGGCSSLASLAFSHAGRSGRRRGGCLSLASLANGPSRRRKRRNENWQGNTNVGSYVRLNPDPEPSCIVCRDYRFS